MGVRPRPVEQVAMSRTYSPFGFLGDGTRWSGLGWDGMGQGVLVRIRDRSIAAALHRA